MRTSQSYGLPGLSGPVEILIDRWGVPHIYAENVYDAVRAQGFNAARDRLWQIDFWRRRGLGLVSDALGPAYVERDRAARLLLYRGDMHAEWLAYGSDTKRVVTAFTEGINTYIELTRDDPGLLPPEFRELDYLPALWAPEDIPRIRSNGLFYNLRQEVARALVMRDFGPEVEDLRRAREPAHRLSVPEGLDLDLIPDDVLAVYDLAVNPVAPEVQAGGADEGSNNWVLAGSRTRTGRPLFANDPHRAVTLPSLRYIVHLSAPGFDVVGGGEPALPGISVGHNGRIAFGFTVWGIDQEDLYVYRTNPDNPREYWYRDRWEPMEEVHEQIPVKGGRPASVELAYTRHGPVLYADPARRSAFALRAAWLEPGMAPYLGSLAYLRAQGWDDFLEGMNRWGAPPENQVYAGTDGTIGWKPAGLTPIRPNWDGTLPVPGDGRYEWAGFYDADQLPVSVNPECGWLATANELNLPPEYPADRTIGYEWASPHRRWRIGEVVERWRDASADDLVALQGDHISLTARRVLARLDTLPIRDDRAREGLDLFRGWNGDLRSDSAPAALFEFWYRRHLRPALLTKALEQVVPADQCRRALLTLLPEQDPVGDVRVDLDLMEQPGKRLGPDPEGALADVVEESMREALDELGARLGPDPAQWAWGKLHTAHLTHPLVNLLPGLPREWTAVGPRPRGGSGDTVGATSYTPDFVQSGGATFRVVIDVGDWDGSLAMNAPGQSGDPRSPHFADLFPAWAEDEAFPLLYSRGRVEDVTEERISLEPRPTTEPLQ